MLWNSGDEYAGQVSQTVESGVGEYKIYLLSKEASPNWVSIYRGQLSGGKMGPYGVTDFPDGRTFAGQWVDERPNRGYCVQMATNRPYQYYFGDMGAFQDDHGLNWPPHGVGVGISVKTRLIFVGRFDRGDPGGKSISMESL